MSYKVTLQPSAHAFEVPEGQSVLQAGLDAGFMMPYSCRTGVCRTCRGTIKAALRKEARAPAGARAIPTVR
jgi:CDP-4-dehydro-6-deoxyglucose reductase